jgi:hypothetical protein
MQLFLWVLTKVSICAKLCVKTMSMQDHLLLVLMKLRLGLLNRDLLISAPVFPAFVFLILKTICIHLGG